MARVATPTPVIVAAAPFPWAVVFGPLAAVVCEARSARFVGTARCTSGVRNLLTSHSPLNLAIRAVRSGERSFRVGGAAVRRRPHPGVTSSGWFVLALGLLMSLLVTGCEEADRQSSSQPAPTAATQTPAAIPRPDADFDGDGNADLAFGGGWREVKDAADDGVVLVVYGTARDVTPGHVQAWSEMDFNRRPTPSFGSRSRRATSTATGSATSRSERTTLLSTLPGSTPGSSAFSTALPRRPDRRAESAMDSEQPWHHRTRGVK